MKKSLKYLLLLLLPCVVYVLLMFILVRGRFYGFHAGIILSIFLFWGITFLSRKKALNSKDRTIKTVLIALPALIFAGFCLSSRQVFTYSPPFLFGPIIGILLALANEKIAKKTLKVATLFVPVFIGVWLYFYGATIWQHYMIYETFKSGATFRKAPVFAFKMDADTLTNADFKGQIVVLDFWNTSCPYCYRKFSVLKEKYEKWTKYKNVIFYSVNCPVAGRDTIGEAEAVLKNYNLPMVNLTGPNADVKIFYSLGVRVFPTTVVLNPAGDVVFWGDVERIDQTMEKQLENLKNRTRQNYLKM